MSRARRILAGFGYFLWHDRLREEDEQALEALGARLARRWCDRSRGVLGVPRRGR